MARKINTQNNTKTRRTQRRKRHSEKSIFVSKSQVDELSIQTVVKENSNVAQY